MMGLYSAFMHYLDTDRDQRSLNSRKGKNNEAKINYTRTQCALVGVHAGT